MKKKHLIFAVLLVILSLIVTAVAVIADDSDNIKEDKPVKIKAFTTSEADKSYHAVDNTSTFGIRLNVGLPFDSFSFCMPTNGTRENSCATLAVYKWEGSYEATLEKSPCSEESFDHLKDNATNTTTFDELPAGEYLFVIQDTIDHAGVWMHSTVVYPSKVYSNGMILEGYTCEITVGFTKTPINPFLELSEDIDPYGDWTPPTEYVIPDDSLIKTHEVLPDTWVFTDGLGRVSLTYNDVGGLKDDRTVAIFYSDWHVDLAESQPFNVNNFIEEHPEAKNDYNHSGWPKSGVAYFWNEPIWGYYRTDDAWVLRKQAELMANAGIDTIFTDNTNGNFTWRSSYTAIYEAWSEAMDDGVKSPKVCYLLPFAPTDGNKEQITSIFLDIYRPEKYQKLWFYFDGKPMLMAYSGNFNKKSGIGKEILNCFTWRGGQPAYLVDKTSVKTWGWLSAYPQALYYESKSDQKNGIVEQVTVGVSQNFSWVDRICTAMNGTNITGRSYTTTGYHTEENAKLYGYNLAEQFEYALSVNPRVLFITGWNEWTAGRQQEWGSVKNAFADQFNDEYSRDIEPTKGDLKDYYYYETVNYIRQYKGCHEMPTPTYSATIDIKQNNSQWDNVGPYFAAYIGNADNRDNAKGYGNLVYSDYSGRNDIIGAKVARDNDYVYFMVECNDNITPYTDSLWMNLLIDTDADGKYNGWESFDFVIGKTPATADKVTLEKFTGNGYESVKVAECAYTVDGKYMQIAVKKSDLGLSDDSFTINFSWTDNVHDSTDTGTGDGNNLVYTSFTGDILDFYTSGDVAPGGRFKFSYVSTDENAHEQVETTRDEETTAEEITTAQVFDETSTEALTAADTTAEEAATVAAKSSGCKSVAAISAIIPMIAVSAITVIKKKKQTDF